MESVKEIFYELKSRWAKADNEGRKEVNKELDLFFASLTEEDNKLLLEAMQEDFARIRMELDRIRKNIQGK